MTLTVLAAVVVLVVLTWVAVGVAVDPHVTQYIRER